MGKPLMIQEYDHHRIEQLKARLGVDARYAADRKAPVRARVRLVQDPSAVRRVFV